MKKLKLVALLAIFALTVATFVTMLAMPTSAAVADANTDGNVYTGYATDSAATSAGCIGRFGDSTGTSVEYVKSMQAVKTRLGDSAEYAKFNLLVDLTTSVRLHYYNETNTVDAVIDGNNHTITVTGGDAQHFKGKVTIKNLTITGAVDYLTQTAGNGVVFGSGTYITNTKTKGNPMIVTGGVTVTVDGATITGTTGTNGVIVPWGDNCIINVKSGKLINASTDASIGPSGLSFAKYTNATFNISGGTIEAMRPINYPSADCSSSKLNISGGTLTQLPNGTSNADAVFYFSSNSTNKIGTKNATVTVTGGTFNCDGIFVLWDTYNTNNTVKISGNPVITTKRASRGFIQDVSGGNNTVTISGGTINSVGYGIVAHGNNSKFEITGGTFTVANNFIHLGAGSGQSVNIAGNPTIICGASTTDHDKNLVYAAIASAGKINIGGGTIYCGDLYQTAAANNVSVDVTGGTVYCENALYSTDATGAGTLNISGGTVNCTNAALWVTSGGATLKILDGATINTTNLLGTRAYVAASGDVEEVQASTGIGNLKMFGGTVNCTGNVISLGLGAPAQYVYQSAVEIYGGTIKGTDSHLIAAASGGAGTIDIYGGEFELSHRVAQLTSNTTLTLNIYGGTFKSLYSSTDTGTDTTITTGLVFMSAGNAHANIYGGRFYILTDLTNVNSLAATGAHLVPWAGAMDNMNFYGGEFFGGTHVYTKLAHASGKVDTANSTYVAMEAGQKYLRSPETVDGASIRIAADSMGIRFQSTITKAVLDNAKSFGTVKYGTIIVPLDFGMAYGADLLNSTANYIKIEATSAGTTTDANGNVTFRAALTNVKEANLTRQFVACAYIDITLSDGTVVTIYSNDKAIRSIDEVAKAALADFKTEIDETETVYVNQTSIVYDTEKKAYVIATEPVYTRYNDAQISAIRKCSPAQ